MPRPWVWLQLVLGWLPVWALYTTLLYVSHPGTPLTTAGARGTWAVGVAAVLGLGVWRATERWPWPHPFRWGFAARHLGLASLYAFLFATFTFGIDFHLQAFTGFRPSPEADLAWHLFPFGWLTRFLVLGVWFYVMVAGVAYATRGTERAARAEALAAAAELAALRAQLNPHFLFNALHTVVHLIPREPARAAEAAEQLAELLRATLEERRELVSLAEEWSFVERYLAIERIRFGERLGVETDFGAGTDDVLVPAFAVQTLVENAVRHGVGPRVEATAISVRARCEGDRLVLTVRDTGAGASPEALHSGTGLGRLRDRLAALYGDAARLELTTAPGDGFVATVTVPVTGDA
jgi:two-component system, LytTR family, sensor kinase